MLRRLMKGLNKQEGFTLLEVLVVIAILGIIAALITPKFLDVMKEARVDTARAGAKQIQMGLERHNFKNNEYPSDGATGDIHDYDTLRTILGSSANLPAAADASIGYLDYDLAAAAGDPAYTLILSVTGVDDRCIEVTPETIKAGDWDSTASTCTPDA